MSNVSVAALYKFVPMPARETLAPQLRERCSELGILGTLLLASEGINGTIAGTPEHIETFLTELRAHPGLEDLEPKYSTVPEQPFRRMKVHIKKEIVTMGVPGVDPTQRVGTYLNPEQWNELLRSGDVVVLDTRNDYEVQMGTFQGAVNPKTTTFREFPAYVRANLDPSKNKKVAMFCTGGIRCEKASSFMLGEGFEEVFHLQGGILKYLENMPKEQSLWEGDCFVFDRRVAVDHELAPGEHTICDQCQHPLSAEDRASSKFEQDVSCPHCFSLLSDADKHTLRARARILRPVPATLRAR
jgi:UPF0176 protein